MIKEEKYIQNEFKATQWGIVMTNFSSTYPLCSFLQWCIKLFLHHTLVNLTLCYYIYLLFIFIT